MSRSKAILAAAVSTALASGAFAQVDGGLGSNEYNPGNIPLAIQTVPTGFGNNLSELNAFYGILQSNGAFKFLLTGNMEPNGNGLVVFVDANNTGSVASTLPGGFGLLGEFGGRYTDDWGGDVDGNAGPPVPPPGGPSILDPGFNPERSIETNIFGPDYYINVIDMTLPNAPSDNRDIYIGTNVVNNPSVVHPYVRDNGATPAGQIEDAFNNTNVDGVNGYDFGTPPGPLGDPLTATTGFEAELSPLFVNADPLKPLRLLAFVTSGGGDFLSNQFLPGLPGSPENLGGPGGLGGTPLFDASAFAGNQYLEIALPTYTGGSSNYSATTWNWPRPNGVNTSAVFAGAVVDSAGGTITMDVPVTFGGIRFASVGAYTLAGPNTITLDTFGAEARVDAEFGSGHQITAATSIQKNVHFSASNLASATLTNVTYATGIDVRKTGAGTISVNNVRADDLLVQGGTLRMITNGGNSGTSRVNTVAVSSGAWDLNDNDAVIGSTSYSAVRGLVTSGRNSGAWNGTGINSSAAASNPNQITGLGVVSGADYIPVAGTSFSGQTVSATDVLIKYTYNGDTDLNGSIDFDDYARIDTTFLGGGVTNKWFDGDFDYSDSVDFDDYALIDAAFLLQGGPLDSGRFGGGMTPGGISAGMTAMDIYHLHAEMFGEGYINAFWSLVPEPSSLSLLGVAAVTILRRRR
jgi:hypothetical protein